MTDGDHYDAIQKAIHALNNAIKNAKDAGLSVEVEILDVREIGQDGRSDLVTAKLFRPIQRAL